MSGGLNEQQADSLLNAYGGLLRRVSELESALEFYAEEDHYRCAPWSLGTDGVPLVEYDAGKRARTALARAGQQQGGGTAE